MKNILFILALVLGSQICLANASDDQGFHDCRLAAGEVAKHFFADATGIMGLKVTTPVFFSNKSNDAYLFYGRMSNNSFYEIAVKIADEDSCLPKSVIMKEKGL